MDINKEEVITYFIDEKYMPLLPLLESALSKIQETYPEIKEEKLQALVKYALNWEAYDYWQSKAVSWLEEGLLFNSETEQILSSLVLNKKASQKLRYRTTKLINSQKLTRRSSGTD